ncbi:MAG: hypothetical protein LLG04_16665 [Parachlamydia sp.]|nr:hypothetical protein [Parachlamydia sp.]
MDGSSELSGFRLSEDFEMVAKEIRFEGLKNSLEQSIGILKTIEGLPRDVKVYRDVQGGVAPSAGSVVGLIERLKPQESTFVGRMLKAVSKSAQAVSRSYYKEDYQSTRRAIRSIEDEILASLLMTREAIEMPESHLSHIDLLKLKTQIEKLRQQFVASKAGLQNLVMTYEERGTEEPTKQETIKQAAEHMDLTLEEEMHGCLAQIDIRLAQIGIKIVPPEKTTETRSSSPETAVTTTSSPVITAARTPSPETEVTRTPSPVITAARTPSPERKAVINEDFSQQVDISRELEGVKAKPETDLNAAAAQAARAFETLELGGTGMKEVLNGLSKQGVYSLRCYVVSYWKHRCFKDEPLMSDDDPRSKRLAQVRFNGLTLKEALDRLTVPELVLLKDRLVRYWFTFGK